MSRSFRAHALGVVSVALLAVGCQDYNFNPVGHCMLQPGSQQFTLSNVSSADVLFVVDDSGSMAGKQAALAAAFDDFVENLTSTNRGRAESGLLPLDFHIAVTTTGVYYNRQTSNQVCRSNCVGANGQLACCVGTTPQYAPRSCTNVGTVDVCTAGMTCRATCNGFLGEATCCLPDNTFPAAAFDASGGKLVTCPAGTEGLPCGKLETHYPTGTAFTDQCPAATQGIALPGLPFPDGAFVGSTSVSAVKANPRVLHFDKRLYLTEASAPPGQNAQGFTMDELKAFFRQNVRVGTCGSAQEQGLEAAKRALERALPYTAKMDTYTYSPAAGLSATGAINKTQAFSVVNGIPVPGAVAEWPNRTSASKLVLVWVGDEDDCSAPKDPAGGVVLLDTDTSGADACFRDATTPAPLGGKAFDVASRYVNYFTGLGRDMGAAFIVSARSASDPTSCSGDACVADLCCDFSCSAICPPPSGGVCGGQGPGTRLIDTAHKLGAKGSDVVVGSVCGDFKPLLREVAEIVKPPQTLSLPSVPAESRIAILRIADGTGTTRKICGRPLEPRQPNYTRQEAEDTGRDWWFSEKADPGPPFDPTGTSSVAVPTKFVYINPKGACIANPGETYSADYLGVVPPQGCSVLPGDTSGGQVLGSADCKEKLGGQFADWECFIPPGLTLGTCTCRSGG